MKGLIYGSLLFVTLPALLIIGIIVAGLLVIWEIGQILCEGINGK